MLAKIIKKALAYDKIEASYQKRQAALTAKKLLNEVLEDWNIDVVELGNVEQFKDPLHKVLIVANHPFGGLEGMILTRNLLEKNIAVKILVNPILNVFKQLREHFLFAFPYQDHASQKANIKATKAAITWLQQGHALAMFPAGEVSSLKLNSACVVDPDWSKSSAMFIEKTQCSVLPIYFKGHNSTMFQVLGLLHPKLRTVLLGRELINKQNQTIHMVYGTKIPYSKLPQHLNRKGLADYLRFLTYSVSLQVKIEKKQYHNDDIAKSMSAEDLRKEIEGLADESLLLKSKNFSVYMTSYSDIPKMMHEIARQRELTFRVVGEGTGKSLDLDKYDKQYKHLFVWDNEKHRLVGAYRIGLSDELKKNKRQFYSESLFGFENQFIAQLEPAIEMGRSFVVLEYQKSFAPLLMLWKGIGVFVSKHPQYAQLFGPVSISGGYSSLSKTVIKQFLLKHYSDQALQKHVHVKTPWKDEKLFDYEIKKIESFFDTLNDVSNFISFQEKEYNAVPVLIKHYIKLGAKFIDFNVDPEFNNSLDALIVVDLRQTEEKILKNYMGEQGYAEFKAYHAGQNLKGA